MDEVWYHIPVLVTCVRTGIYNSMLNSMIYWPDLTLFLIHHQIHQYPANLVIVSWSIACLGITACQCRMWALFWDNHFSMTHLCRLCLWCMVVNVPMRVMCAASNPAPDMTKPEDVKVSGVSSVVTRTPYFDDLDDMILAIRGCPNVFVFCWSSSIAIADNYCPANIRMRPESDLNGSPLPRPPILLFSLFPPPVSVCFRPDLRGFYYCLFLSSVAFYPSTDSSSFVPFSHGLSPQHGRKDCTGGSWRKAISCAVPSSSETSSE